MKTFKIEGIVIKRKNSGEADRFLTVFTKFHGKMSIKAPGVRRIASRRSSHVELINHAVLSLYSSSSNAIPVLTEASTLYNFDTVKRDLGKMGFAFYICELIDRLCPQNQENRAIFYLLKETLEKLESEEDTSKLIDRFEEDLLTLLGFMPEKFLLKNRQAFIEQILERKINAGQILHLLVG